MASYSYRLPRKYRKYARKGKLTSNQAIAAVVIVVAAAAATGNHKTVAGAARHAGAGLDAATIPGGSDLGTRSGWDRAFLAALGDRVTSCDFNAVMEWEVREGGGFGNQASFNVLNVNPGPGAGWPGYSATGAWAFPDAATGLRYTVATVNNGDYGAILSALRAGNSAQAVCDAIMASPWAASHYDGTLTASC